MNYLDFVSSLFVSKKINFADFIRKKILLIGGYSLQMIVNENQPPIMFAKDLQRVLNQNVDANCKLAATFEQKSNDYVICDYVLTTEELATVPPHFR